MRAEEAHHNPTNASNQTSRPSPKQGREIERREGKGEKEKEKGREGKGANVNQSIKLLYKALPYYHSTLEHSMPRRGEGSFFFCASCTGSIKPAHAQRKARRKKPETRNQSPCSLEARKNARGGGCVWALGTVAGVMSMSISICVPPLHPG